MKRHIRIYKFAVLFISCLVIPFLPCGASDIGALYSPKEFGLELRMVKEQPRQKRIIRITADMHGILSGHEKIPGLKVSYLKAHRIGHISQLGEDTAASFFLGSGFSTGYVKDYKKDFGLMGSFCTAVGVQFSFLERTFIRLCLTGELGLHFDSNDAHDTSLTIYKNGIIKALIPELSITYSF